jgi:hypothetical protein
LQVGQQQEEQQQEEQQHEQQEQPVHEHYQDQVMSLELQHWVM